MALVEEVKDLLDYNLVTVKSLKPFKMEKWTDGEDIELPRDTLLQINQLDEDYAEVSVIKCSKALKQTEKLGVVDLADNGVFTLEEVL